jgi:hypothetical protein
MIFRSIGVRVAELTVPAGPASFVLQPGPGPDQESGYEVRVAGRARWRIVVGYSPCDAWRVDPVPAGCAADPDPAGDGPDPDVERAYAAWAAGTRAETGQGVLRTLPPGRYRLVRSSLQPRWTRTVVLGDEHVPRPPHIAVLLDGPNHFALAVGPSAEHPPDFDAPLVGVVSLGYAASSTTVGVLLFAGVAAAPEPAVAPDGDLVFVVPVAGPLVGVLEAGAQPPSAAAAAAWAHTGADRLVTALTGPFGS